jgi:hypothetical protein
MLTDYRHEVRLRGAWGGCYEVSCFSEEHFGWRRREGVWQLPDGTPVFRHCWNEAADGTIIDATADQFFYGHDIAVLPPDYAGRTHYRLRYTRAINPGRTSWLADRPFTGEPDDDWWKRRYDERGLGPGW